MHKQIDVRIPDKIYKKVMWFVDKSPVEISVLGRVVNVDGALLIEDVYLPVQTNSAAETDMCPESIAQLMYKTKDMRGTLNCWIHSHVNMGTNWSGTDYNTMAQIGGEGYCLAIVFNKKREFRCAYYQKGDGFRANVFMDNLPVTVVSDISPETEAKWTKLYESRCKKPVYTYNHKAWNTGGAWNAKATHGNGTQSTLNLGKEADYKKSSAIGIKPRKGKGNTNPSIKLSDYSFEGAVHPEYHHLRYSTERCAWITYDRYIKDDDKYDFNLLDTIKGEREKTAKEFFKTYKNKPCDDYDLNDYYMETNNISFFDFYLDVEIEEEEEEEVRGVKRV